jgi:hypothetical protein
MRDGVCPPHSRTAGNFVLNSLCVKTQIHLIAAGKKNMLNFSKIEIRINSELMEVHGEHKDEGSLPGG